MQVRESVKKVAVLGMLAAVYLVLGQFAIRLEIDNIGFTFLPVALAGALYGPVGGALVGVAGDFLVAVLGPYGYFPLMGTTALLGGCIYGLFLHRKWLSLPRVIACVLTESVLCSVLLQTFWLNVLYDKSFMVLLPTRLIQNAITAPVMVLCILAVVPGAVRLVQRNRARTAAD